MVGGQKEEDNMAIPRNVARQGERAEAIRKKVYEEGKTPAELGIKADPPPGEAPPKETETPIPAGDNIEPGKGTPPAEDYKTKYEEALHQINTLKGKLDSEVPDLVSVNRMQAGQIAELQGMVSDLQTKVNKPAEEPTPATPDPQEAEDLKIYENNYPEIRRGQLIVMRNWVKSEEFKAVVHSTVEPRVASVEKDVKTSKEETFATKLDRLVKDENGNPCWRQINDDKEFTARLKTQKRGGTSDFELLRVALSRGDADGVAEFFTDWQKFKKPATPPAKNGGDGKPVVEEDLSLAPAKPGRGQPPKKPGDGEDKPKTFTRSFVKKYHTDVALGRYKNRPKDRERIKAEIDEAMSKGLIVNG